MQETIVHGFLCKPRATWNEVGLCLCWKWLLCLVVFGGVWWCWYVLVCQYVLVCVKYVLVCVRWLLCGGDGSKKKRNL